MTCLCVRATTFCYFDIVMLHECINMVQCVAYIHDLCNLDLGPQYQNYIFTMNLSLARWSLLFDKGIPNFGCFTMRQQVVYILDLCMTLTFDLYVGGWGNLSEFYSQFYLVCICHRTI